MPGPSSATRIRTPSGTRLDAMYMRPPRPASASTAFLINDSSAHSSSTASPWIMSGSSPPDAAISHGVRERRHACAKVSADPIDQVSHVDWILARRTSDALEAMRDTLEPIEVAAHVRDAPSR